MPVHHLAAPRVANHRSRRGRSGTRPMPTTRGLRSHQHRSAAGDATNLRRDRVDAGSSETRRQRVRRSAVACPRQSPGVHLPATDRRCRARLPMRHTGWGPVHRTADALRPARATATHRQSCLAKESDRPAFGESTHGANRMGIANLQTSTKIFAHGDPVNDGTVRTRSLYTSTFLVSVRTQGLGGREAPAEPGPPGAAGPAAPVVAPYGDLAHK